VSSQARQSEYQFDLTGGTLALDFANTISRRSVPERRAEHLGCFEDLLTFARQSGLISQSEEGELRAQGRKAGSQAERLLRKALHFREAVYRAFSKLASGKAIAAVDLAEINRFSSDALAHRRLMSVNGGYQWDWVWEKAEQLERVLWPIALATADLLTSDERASVRLCEADDCDWLFLDNSRNHTRRWCDMKSCGNRAKARRHYQRMHEE
jgi:predicted RNA-binding Zn ribbon-like protein